VLILVIPVIFLPVVGFWYINIGRIGHFTRAARRKQINWEQGTGSLTAERLPVKRDVGEQHNAYSLSEKVYRDLEDILAKTLDDSWEEGVKGTDSISSAVMIDTKVPELDDYGYMLHPEMWSEEIAELLARVLVPGGLTEEHWRILYYLREYYLKFDSVPAVRKLCRDTGLSLKRIYILFPGNRPRGLGAGLAKCACKVAGMPWLGYKQYP